LYWIRSWENCLEKLDYAVIILLECTTFTWYGNSVANETALFSFLSSFLTFSKKQNVFRKQNVFYLVRESVEISPRLSNALFVLCLMVCGPNCDNNTCNVNYSTLLFDTCCCCCYCCCCCCWCCLSICTLTNYAKSFSNRETEEGVGGICKKA